MTNATWHVYYYVLLMQSNSLAPPTRYLATLASCHSKALDGFPAMHFTRISRHPRLSPSPWQRHLMLCNLTPITCHNACCPVPTVLSPLAVQLWGHLAQRDGRSGTATAAADDFSPENHHLVPICLAHFKETSIQHESLMGSSCCPDGHHTHGSISNILSIWWPVRDTSVRRRHKKQRSTTSWMMKLASRCVSHTCRHLSTSCTLHSANKQ